MSKIMILMGMLFVLAFTSLLLIAFGPEETRIVFSDILAGFGVFGIVTLIGYGMCKY